MKAMKKIIVALVAIVIVIDFNFICVKAKNVFKADITSIDNNTKVSYNNIEINNEYNKPSFVVGDISKGFGECIYNKTNVAEVKVNFYHRLSTIAYKVNNGAESEYCLGISGENNNKSSFLENKSSFLKVKYLPQTCSVDGLRDGMYINCNSTWQRCMVKSSDGDFAFIPLGKDESDKLKKYKDDMVDYGVNIYASSDGKQFKKLDTELKKVEKILPNIDDEEFQNGTNIFLEKLYTKKVPEGTKYIKVQINEVAKFFQDDGDSVEGDHMAFVSSIKFTLNDDGDEEELLNGNEKTNSDVPKTLLGDSKKIVVTDSENKAVDKLRTQRKISLGSSFGSYNNDSTKFENTYIRRNPYYNKKKKIVYMDDDGNVVEEVTKYRDSKKRKRNNSNTVRKNKEDNLKDDGLIDSLAYDELDTNFDDELTNFETPTKNKCKKVSRSGKTTKKKRKEKGKDSEKSSNIDGDIVDAKILEATEGTKLSSAKGTEKDQNNMPKELSNKDEKQEEEDKQAKTEKTVSALYLSGLSLTLGSVFIYDKLGWLKNLFIR